MSVASPRDDGSFSAAVENRGQAARRQGRLITQQDHSGFGGRGKSGETEPQGLADASLRVRVWHPANRPRRRWRRLEPRWYDGDDRIQTGADGALNDVLQQRAAIQLRELFG